MYPLANETNMAHNYFLLYFVNIIYNLYMFRNSPCPSSGGTTVFDVTLGTCLNTSAKCHTKYSCSSWWWTWRGPKHVEIINNIDKIHW